MWNADPDSFSKQGNPLLPSLAQGKRGGISSACSVLPGRIDFHLLPPSPPQDVEQPSFHLIEDAGHLHAELANIIGIVGEGRLALDSIVRIALNIQFLALNSNFDEGNVAITAIIPRRLGAFTISDEEDFIFQVNQPYTSEKIEDIRMNFLTKWSVDRIQVQTMQVLVGGVGGPLSLGGPVNAASAKPQIVEFIGASVILDINNIPTGNVLSGQQQAALLFEALDQARRTQQTFGLNVDGF
jgi:hypothetical protein